MDGSRFDNWTRRRFGLAAGGFAASLLGLARLEEAEAKNNKPKKDKKPKKAKKCKKLGTGCNPTAKFKKCCGPGVCQSVDSVGGNRCCQTLSGSVCSSDSECCGNMRCVGSENNKTCLPPLL